MANAGAFPIPPSTRFRAHSHDVSHICVVLEGGFIERDRKSWRDVGPGTLRVSGAARHDIDFSTSGALCLVLDFDSGVVPALERPRFIENDVSLVRLAREIQNVSGSGDPARNIVSENLTIELLAQVSRRIHSRTSPPPEWLSRVREMLHDEAGNLTVTQLATDAGVHRVHLARTFREHFGVSVTRYARQVRVQSALRLLSHRSIPLSRVALEAGFSDQSHMTRAMRDTVGSTPGAIRSMLHPFKT